MWPPHILDQAFFNVAVGLFVLFLSIGSLNLLSRYVRNSHTRIKRSNRAHIWQHIQNLSQSCWCSVCESLLITTHSYYCEACGVCADSGCIKIANSKFKCKQIYVEESEPFRHQWLKGNIHEGSHCVKCKEECGVDHGTTDWRCVWCQRTFHTACLSHHIKDEEKCDLGEWKRFIIGPKQVVIENGIIVRLSPSSVPDWTPLFIVCNPKSGNNRGQEIMSCMRGVLNPAQVIELGQNTASVLSDWLQLPNRSLLMVAGGDGSLASVMTILHDIKKNEAAVGVIPLGTGNDLSRVLGWGSTEPAPHFNYHELLEKVAIAKPSPIDRWKVSVGKRMLYMYNYLSVGVDAQVTLDFHRTRQSPFYIYSSRIINKILYLMFGTQQVVERGCKGLEERIELRLDGKHVPLPPVEAIVVLNINSWGAGVPLWTEGNQSISDGRLEVVGIYSSFHIAQLQVGLSSPLILGQASTVEIKLKRRTPMQVDGEPWMQRPSTIDISIADQATVLILPEGMRND